MTGTVLSGSVKINQQIDLPELGQQKKVKSMQMFRKPVQSALQGDRVALCVTSFDAKLMERGIAADVGTVPRLKAAIVSVSKIRYSLYLSLCLPSTNCMIRFHKAQVESKSKFHITAGYSTVMGTPVFFGRPRAAGGGGVAAAGTAEEEGAGAGAEAAGKPASGSAVAAPFDLNAEYLYQDQLFDTSEAYPEGSQYALLTLEQDITTPLETVLIASKLDTDIREFISSLLAALRLTIPNVLSLALALALSLSLTGILNRHKHVPPVFHR